MRANSQYNYGSTIAMLLFCLVLLLSILTKAPVAPLISQHDIEITVLSIKQVLHEIIDEIENDPTIDRLNNCIQKIFTLQQIIMGMNTMNVPALNSVAQSLENAIENIEFELLCLCDNDDANDHACDNSIVEGNCLSNASNTSIKVFFFSIEINHSPGFGGRPEAQID